MDLFHEPLHLNTNPDLSFRKRNGFFKNLTSFRFCKCLCFKFRFIWFVDTVNLVILFNSSAYYQLHFPYCPLPVAYCLLLICPFPIANLPIAHLPLTHCPLLVAYCPLVNCPLLMYLTGKMKFNIRIVLYLGI